MPKFDASSIADCEYDLTGIRSVHTGEYIQDKGVVPEPSRQLVSSTMKRISAAYRDATGEEVDSTPDAITEAMQEAEDETFEHMSDALLEVIADFCQGHPTKESLDALPWPRFMAFFGYIMENMLSPEVSAPGSNATPKRLRSV